MTKYYLFVDKNDHKIKYYYKHEENCRVEIAFAGTIIRIEKSTRKTFLSDSFNEYIVYDINSYEFEKQLTLAKMLIK